MVKSTVVDNASGKSMDSRIRTSSGTFLRRGQDKVVQDIERRIAEFSMIPVENGEGFQVLHYEQGQKYEVRSFPPSLRGALRALPGVLRLCSTCCREVPVTRGHPRVHLQPHAPQRGGNAWGAVVPRLPPQARR
mmetsp:Transcript_62607/g.198234  ORF Transcript_62607/g.198234 Transcript_62607/m.198234 type:complete len:134 (-) Transcript_62607:418-819(-)